MIYKEDFVVPYYDTNLSGLVSPESLLAYMGEIATLHSDHVGVTIEKLRENNFGWMLNRWKVKINKYPKARDSIQVNTWASDFVKFYGNREFNILDENKDELVKASSIWIFIDFIRKRPLRVTEDIVNSYGIEGGVQFEDYYDFNKPFDTGDGLEFRVRKSDIDYNNHVNNVKYFQWMLEALPDYIDSDYLLDEFEILYKKEVGLGSLIYSSYNESVKDKGIIFLHKIEEEGSIRAYGKTIWKKRP